MTTLQKPKKRKTPWVRRIVSTLILLALIALLVFLVARGVIWIRGVFQEGRDEAAESAVPKPVVIEQCAATSLDISLEPTESFVEEGAGVRVSVSVTNTGEADCKITQAQLGVQLVGDNEVLWEPGACSEAMQESMLLLAPGQPWSTTLRWDGLRYFECAVPQSGMPAVVGEGSYLLEARVLGGKTRASVPLVVQ